MAKRVNTLPKRSRGQKYPWDEWMDGSIWSAEKGVDFDTAADSFRALVHNAARVRGLKATTRVSGDEVIFTAVKHDG